MIFYYLKLIELQNKTETLAHTNLELVTKVEKSLILVFLNKSQIFGDSVYLNLNKYMKLQFKISKINYKLGDTV